jgi:hypothetical protein
MRPVAANVVSEASPWQLFVALVDWQLFVPEAPLDAVPQSFDSGVGNVIRAL